MDTPSDLSYMEEPVRPEAQQRSNTVPRTQDNEYIQNLPLYRAIDQGDWETAKNSLSLNTWAQTANLTSEGNKPLHVAVLAGNVDIVEQLVNRLSKEDLELKNKDGDTALIFAATGRITAIAEHMIKKNPMLITIPNAYNQIPVVVASLYGHKDMVQYLYSQTPKQELSPENSKNGAMLLTSCIMGDIFDVALDLIKEHPSLAVALDSDNDTAPVMLAQKPSAFPSGLESWQRFIYSLICIHSPQFLRNSNGDIERLHNGSTPRRNTIAEGLHKLVQMFWRHLKDYVPAVKTIYDLKLTHAQAQELLCCICEAISTRNEAEFEKIRVKRAVFIAVKNGIVEFIEEIIKYYPDIIWINDDVERGIFHYATARRQEKIFSLIYRMGEKESLLVTNWDNKKNNILHQAALKAPSSELDRISGAALQMQRELQWFKEVEQIVPPKYTEMVNEDKKTPRELFTEEHKDLKKEGEEWMKNTAESCTLVAVLIATITFAAAFTLPGGNDQDSGDPKYLNRKSFMVFIISDALSLLASSTSLLMFLGILSTRYKEEDFLMSLPIKLILGLSTLFFSIASMMVTFGVTLDMMLRKQVPTVSLPIILLGSLPAAIFAVLQFPLLIEILWSTFGPGIFDKPRKGSSFLSGKMWKTRFS